jgi:hypothetical protein
MSTGLPPSTQWRERVAPDEAQRFERIAAGLRRMQEGRNAALGTGRALHRRQLLALRGSFEVLAPLPPAAAQGLFAQPGRHEAWLRLSNGGSGRSADRRPDVRGLALKVFGVQGPCALGEGEAREQDFLLIQFSATAFSSSEEFAEVAFASARGPLAVVAALVRRHGPWRGLQRLRRIAASIAAPFTGFATQPLHSALPIACGPYAARVRLLPPPGEVPDPAARDGWGADLLRRLQARDLVYDFQLQFYADEASTPIEDASVDWSESVAPYVTVARLTLPRQAADPELERRVEQARFDPWAGLMAHRPLGELMRARKAAYLASQQGRGVA